MDNALYTTYIATGRQQIKGKENIFLYKEAVLYEYCSYNVIRLDRDLSSDKNGGFTEKLSAKNQTSGSV